MKKWFLVLVMTFLSCASQQQRQDPIPPFNENDTMASATISSPTIIEPKFIKNIDIQKIQEWIDWTKEQLAKAEQLDNATREKLLNDLKIRLIILGLTEQQADDFVNKITPKFERLVRAIISNNKLEIALASASILVAIIPVIIIIIRRRKKKNAV